MADTQAPAPAAPAATLDESQTRPFSLQVAGHDGVLSVEGDKMIIKPLNEREQQFYEGSVSHPEFKAFLPEYYGTLHRSIASEQRGQADAAPEGSTSEKYICLENVASGFRKPCVLDIKIGTRLHDDDATEEKRQRMVRKAQETTTAALGVRVCGMVVHGQPPASRDWCRDLTESTIGGALLQYFAGAEREVSKECSQFIVRQFIIELEEYLQVIEKSEARMYASSLLFVYDADKQRYEEFISGGKKEDGSEEDDRGEDSNDGALLDMRAIDFAHSRWTPGKGQDECYLLGLRKLIQLFKAAATN